jgi:hypothetical protein
MQLIRHLITRDSYVVYIELNSSCSTHDFNHDAVEGTDCFGWFWLCNPQRTKADKRLELFVQSSIHREIFSKLKM